MRPLATRTKRVAGTGLLAKNDTTKYANDLMRTVRGKVYERFQMNRARRVAGTETLRNPRVRTVKDGTSPLAKRSHN